MSFIEFFSRAVIGLFLIVAGGVCLFLGPVIVFSGHPGAIPVGLTLFFIGVPFCFTALAWLFG